MLIVQSPRLDIGAFETIRRCSLPVKPPPQTRFGNGRAPRPADPFYLGYQRRDATTRLLESLPASITPHPFLTQLRLR